MIPSDFVNFQILFLITKSYVYFYETSVLVKLFCRVGNFSFKENKVMSAQNVFQNRVKYFLVKFASLFVLSRTDLPITYKTHSYSLWSFQSKCVHNLRYEFKS